jgi:hypothetical protein
VRQWRSKVSQVLQNLRRSTHTPLGVGGGGAVHRVERGRWCLDDPTDRETDQAID